jgi:hypothetical protein
MTNLVYVHIGKTLPYYIFDSIYQTLLTNNYSTKIFVILSDILITEFNEGIKDLNINLYTKCDLNYLNIINVIPASILENTISFKKYKENVKISDEIKNFRDSFWISTTSRFFYMYSFQELFKIKSFFHIESDVMLYDNLNKIKNKFCEDKMSFVQDNITRVIASIIYINNEENFKILLNYIIEKLIQDQNLNDMNLLGAFVTDPKFKYLIKLFPDTCATPNSELIFDGAALGQFLGGIDPRNAVNMYPKMSKDLLEINNPTVGFINETARIKANELTIFRKSVVYDSLNSNIDLVYILNNEHNEHNQKITKCVNLHCHSKQLYQFSSIFSIKYNDIITGDRILSLCDFVLSTPEILNFHKNITNFTNINNVIVVKDFKNINIKGLNDIFLEKRNPKDKKLVIKLFIYTHILDDFIKYILINELLDKKIKFIIYLHNSDHSLNNGHLPFIENKKIEKVYAQNVTCEPNEKVKLLPIGLGNSMWNHGNLISLYKVMSKSYLLKKTKNVYININPGTYKYRETFLNEVTLQNSSNIIEVSKNKPFKAYLEELSQHHFCLCIRGNGVDTHRYWESLYLQTIPIIINNKHTNMNNFVNYLKELNLPFYEITENNTSKLIEKYVNPDQPFFTKELYKKLLKNKPILLNESLKLNNSE